MDCQFIMVNYFSFAYLWFRGEKFAGMSRYQVRRDRMKLKILAVRVLPFVLLGVCFFVWTIWGEAPNMCC